MAQSSSHRLRLPRWLRWVLLMVFAGAASLIALVLYVRQMTCWYGYENPPTPQETAKWHAEFAGVIPPQCRDFRGIWYNDDITALVFGMSCGPIASTGELWADLRRRMPNFKEGVETPTELVLVRNDLRGRSPRFEEWRFLLDPLTGRVTALFCSIDADEERCHDALVSKLAQCHAAPGLPQKPVAPSTGRTPATSIPPVPQTRPR